MIKTKAEDVKLYLFKNSKLQISNYPPALFR